MGCHIKQPALVPIERIEDRIADPFVPVAEDSAAEGSFSGETFLLVKRNAELFPSMDHNLRDQKWRE